MEIEDPGVDWVKGHQFMEDQKFLTAYGKAAGSADGLAFLAQTYIAPKDRFHPGYTKIYDGVPCMGHFDCTTAMSHARHTAREIEYIWENDSWKDPFPDTSDN